MLSRLTSWFRTGSARQSSFSQERERLRSEQARLAAELEELLASYDEQSKALSSRLASSDEALSDDDLRLLYEDQLRLWRMIRRLQAGERTASQLEQEYAEWKGRVSEREGLLRAHPDHPETRMEFIASELRSRGKTVPSVGISLSFEGSAKDADPYENLNLDEIGDIGSFIEPEIDSLQAIQELPVNSGIRDAVLEQIRECGRQIKRQTSSQELAETYAELRHHHAWLRRMDRRSGVRRYRIVLHE